jgi:hypothetical protein
LPNIKTGMDGVLNRRLKWDLNALMDWEWGMEYPKSLRGQVYGRLDGVMVPGRHGVQCKREFTEFEQDIVVGSLMHN